MKRIIATIVTVVVTVCVFAQAPQKMSYQAVIRDADNVLVTSQTVGMQISILQGSIDGIVVYTEIQTPTTNANGLVSIEIGAGKGFDAINWAKSPYFIKTETDLKGGTNYTIKGTSQLTSVPYALYSKTSENYPETDPVFVSHPANLITSTSINNWNSAFNWGNHAGLYHLISWVPSWADVTGKPSFAGVATSGSYNDLINKPSIINTQWITTGSNIYYNSGNVGIGTSAPNGLLHLVNYTGTQLKIGNSNQPDMEWNWDVDGVGNLSVLNEKRGSPVTFMYINANSGNVGIGTTSPTYLLEVNGSAGKPGGGSWSTSSDLRLKDVHGDYKKGLKEIISLNPILFNYKKDNPLTLPSSDEYIGFIAQDVQKIFPEAISEGKDGFLDFNMHSINVALVNAIKDLNQKVELQQNEINELKALVDTLVANQTVQGNK